MKLTTTVQATFKEGSKVGLHHRLGDYAGDHGAHLGDAIAVSKVAPGGVLEFNAKAIVPDGKYWIGGRDEGGRFRSVAITAPSEVPPEGHYEPGQAIPQDVQAQLRRQMTPSQGVTGGVVEGARSTVSSRPKRDVPPVVAASSIPELHEPQKVTDPTQPEGQADAKGPQRSSTPMGQATPVEKDEPTTGRRPASESKGPQRSDTPLGHETPVDPSEVQPALRQEHVKGPQKSDTPAGTAAPIEPRELDKHGEPGTQQRREHAPPAERKPKKRSGPKSNKSASKSRAKTKRARSRSAQTKAQRSAAAKKAAATRKRNAAKKGGK